MSEKEIVQRLEDLLAHGTKKVEIAEKLGINRQQVYRLIDRHGLKSLADKAKHEYRVLRDQTKYVDGIDALQETTGLPKETIKKKLEWYGLQRRA